LPFFLLACFSSSSLSPGMIYSVLDTDQYKMSMQQAILQQVVQEGEDPLVAYRFTNRGGNLFTRATYEAVRRAVEGESSCTSLCCTVPRRSLTSFQRADLGKLALTKEERAWLEKTVPYYTPKYLDYLEAFRFKPVEQVTVQYVVEDKDAQGQELGRFEIEIKGGWAATILYEVCRHLSYRSLLCCSLPNRWSRAAAPRADRDPLRRFP
jgi:nicotinate phosphoribosyltransferase